MIIAVDFDETLFPTLEKIIDIYNKRHGSELTLSQITTYSFYECLDSSVADEILELFCSKEVYDTLKPFKDAVRVIRTLVDMGHEIYIATATNSKNFEWKEQLLQRYFPFVPKDNLIRIHNKKLLNVDVMIEDNLGHLVKTLAERICFNQPWNQSTSKDIAYNIRRVYGWNGVLNIINDIEKEMKEWEKQ